ncbi:hypothetical protein-transmembrane region and signal peptide prediction, partial [hydrothermal vent metagenome]
TILPALGCPSDPNSLTAIAASGGFRLNYLLCSGDTSQGAQGTRPQLSGMFYPVSRTKVRDVTDGTSNTIMASEIVLPEVSLGFDGRGSIGNSIHSGQMTFTALRPPNTPVGDKGPQMVQGINEPTHQGLTVPAEIHARSLHTGGVHCLMGDGAVRFISENINTGLFQDLGTRAGNEVLGEY